MLGTYDYIEKNKALNKRLKSVHFPTRDQEDYESNPNQKNYELNLSHYRSIARISPSASKQYFQGSSILRKKTVKPELSEIQEIQKKTSKQICKSERRQKNSPLHELEKSYSKQLLESYERQLSYRTKIKIQEKILALYAASNKKFSMITLTMIADCTDRKAVKVLNNFFTSVKKKYGNFNYLWVAERQKNGRIHFHIVANCKFQIQYINSLWISQQIENSIVNSSAVYELNKDYGYTFKQLLKLGYSGWSIAQKYLNPVDVKKIYDIRGVSAYVAKYVTKNKTTFVGINVWHSSRTVSKIFTKQLISLDVFERTQDKKINSIYSKKNNKLYEVKTFIHQYGIINNILNKNYFNKNLKELNLLNSWIINNVEIDQGCKISEFDYRSIFWSYDIDGNLIKANKN